MSLHLFQTKSNHKTDNIYIISDYLFFRFSQKDFTVIFMTPLEKNFLRDTVFHRDGGSKRGRRGEGYGQNFAASAEFRAEAGRPT